MADHTANNVCSGVTSSSASRGKMHAGHAIAAADPGLGGSLPPLTKSKNETVISSSNIGLSLNEEVIIIIIIISFNSPVAVLG